MPQRLLKINELIKHEVGQLLLREVEFPKDCLVTITKVETSRDLRHAKIFISILPFDFNKKVLKKISNQISHLQFLLNKRLSLKPLPRLSFVVDRTEKEAAIIEELLDKIKEKR